jgi:hypothetical protein
MNFRIKQPDTAFSDNVHSKNAKPVKAKSYLDFIRGLPCLISHAYGVEAAHLSAANQKYGHMGRAKSSKASDRFALPLCPQMHREQHAFKGGELAFWKSEHINPYDAANALWGAYQERGTAAHDWAVRMILNDEWKLK